MKTKKIVFERKRREIEIIIHISSFVAIIEHVKCKFFFSPLFYCQKKRFLKAHQTTSQVKGKKLLS
jgi:hypothetical protein